MKSSRLHRASTTGNLSDNSKKYDSKKNNPSQPIKNATSLEAKRRRGISMESFSDAPEKETAVDDTEEKCAEEINQIKSNHPTKKSEMAQYLGLQLLNSRLPKDLQLTMPEGLVQRPMVKMKNENSVRLETRLLGLPGNLNLNRDKSEKYFGDNARHSFYDRYHWVSRHESIIINSETTGTKAFIGREDHLLEFPFAPRRKDRVDSILDDDDLATPTKLPTLEEFEAQMNIKKGSSIDSDIWSSFDRKKNLEKHDRTKKIESCCSTSLQEMSTISSLSANDDNHSISSMTEIIALADQIKNFGENESFMTPCSPRTTYLSACVREKVPPRASLLLRKGFTKRLQLQHLGMGDEQALILATSISGVPFIQSINLRDNRLTDTGLCPIVKSILSIPDLLELDLSENIIGPQTALQLSNYLRNPKCSLERLILQQADVDDFECEKFVDAVRCNNSLKELDLSNNKIGSAENLNTVMPDVVTGGESIAELLRSKSCKLEILVLTWNMIRLGGAVDLASSLNINSTLIKLDISYNSLGRDGGIALGESIRRNTTLREINLSDNSIDSTACFSICGALLTNNSIRKLVLDGNPIGEMGSKAAMMVPLMMGNQLKLSLSRCNVTMKDGNEGRFDFQKILKDFTLNMEDPFERSCCSFLLNLVASHHTYELKSVNWEVPTKTKSRTSPIDLVCIVNQERVKYFDASQNLVLQNLKHLQEASGNIQKAVRLFQEIDKDGSGEIDEQELGELMHRIGIEMSEKRLHEVISTYDTGGDGTIEISEFLLFLRSQHREASLRLKDLLEVPMYAEKQNGPQELWKPYVPPSHGILHLKVVNEFSRKPCHRVLTTCDKSYIIEAARGCGGEFAKMVSYGVNGSMLRLDEGLALYRLMLSESQNSSTVLRNLLPQMCDPKDAYQLLMSATNNDYTEFVRLKREIGSALKPLIGRPNGYYFIDLSHEMDRLCIIRLLEMSRTYYTLSPYWNHPLLGKVGDLSQKGNFTGFRNERLNGRPVTIDSTFAMPLPRSGILEFDYVGGIRPSHDDFAIGDSKFLLLLRQHLLLSEEAMVRAISYLRLQRMVADKLVACKGQNFHPPDEQRAKDIANYLCRFYDHCSQRYDLVKQSQECDLNNRWNPFLLDLNPSLLSGEDLGLFMQELQESIDFFGGVNWEEEEGQLHRILTNSSTRKAGMLNFEDHSDLESQEDSDSEDSDSNSENSEDCQSLGSTVGQEVVQEELEMGKSSSSWDNRQKNTAVTTTTTTTMNMNKNNNPSNTTMNNTKNQVSSESTSLVSSPVKERRGGMKFSGVLGNRSPSTSMDLTSVVSSDADSSNYPLPPTGNPSNEDMGALVDDGNASMISSEPGSVGMSMSMGMGMSMSMAGDSPSKLLAVSIPSSFLSTPSKNNHGNNNRLTQTQTNESNPQSSLTIQLLRLYQDRRQRALDLVDSMEKKNVLPDHMKRFLPILINPSSILPNLAHRYVDILEEILGRHWITCSQVALVVQLLKNLAYYNYAQYFGTYRVDFLVYIFDRIIDLQNFELVMHWLTSYEVAALYARLGWLNLFNPMRPDGAWELDLTRREERVVAKILCALATHEPGDNWRKKSFRWQRDMDCMPGWELTQSWLTEDGMPIRGIINVTYYSGEGKQKRGCHPNVAFRKSLLNLVLISENEVIESELWNKPPPPREYWAGVQAFNSDLELWSSYLAPLRVDNNRKR